MIEDDRKRKEACLTVWREEHPGRTDPDDVTLQTWLVQREREDFKQQWREAHPGQPLPDDYSQVRRAIDERNKTALAFVRDQGTAFH